LSPDLTLVFALVVVAVLQLGGTALLLRWCLVRAAPHEALVLTKLGAPSRLVSFSQVLALPLVARVDVVDLSLRRVVITREGKAGVRCRDGVRADMEVVFVIGVERTVESVLRAAESLGTSRVNDERAVAEHFAGPFADALATAASRFDFAAIVAQREDFRDELERTVGTDLSGYRLERVTLERLARTPNAVRDPRDAGEARSRDVSA
jgi:uncharacterized membrane protein YqiK